jgi:flagellar biosynthesis/type III secretory pathway protein FliH
VLTGALDLNQDSVRRQVLASLAGLDEDRRKIYTVFILTAASPQAQDALEELMTTTEFHHPFVDRLLAEGEAKGLAEGEAKGLAEGEAKGEAKGQAKGEAQMILRILAARGLQPPAAIRERVLACTDTSQLETWGDRAATANTIEDVFGD